MKRKPPHVSHYRDRHNVLRWRFRAKGKPESQTRAVYGSDDWLAWYSEAMTAQPKPIGQDRVKPGTINALCVSYYASGEFKTKRESTRKTYRGILENWRKGAGDKPVVLLRPEHISASMDKRADTPTAANNLLKVLRSVFRHAMKARLAHSDPTRGIRVLKHKTAGFHTWTEAEIAKFEARWPVGTRERLAFDLLLCTAQRSSDVRQLGPGNLVEGYIRLTQQKTGVELDVPIHPKLQASLDTIKDDRETYLLTSFGKPYTAAGFGNWMRDAAKEAGLPTGRSPHGLRKAGARRLAECGCSANEIMSITGHTTLKEVERYTRAAGQRHMADGAMARMGLANPTGGKTNADPQVTE